MEKPNYEKKALNTIDEDPVAAQVYATLAVTQAMETLRNEVEALTDRIEAAAEWITNALREKK